MKCEQCGERPAEITLTEMEGEEMNTLHLCASCAALKGVTGGVGSPPVADLLAHLGAGEKRFEADAEACDYCGMRQRDFRKNGRLGCPQCYVHFATQLRELFDAFTDPPNTWGRSTSALRSKSTIPRLAWPP